MSCIEIIKVPAGEAPLHIRQAWVGLQLPLTEQEESGSVIGAEGGAADPANADGYDVSIGSAIHSLQIAKKHKAATYWANKPFPRGSKLRFGKEFCRYIP